MSSLKSRYEEHLAALLASLAAGEIGVEAATRELARLPYSDLGYARVDHHRALRSGLAEAVYGPGKTPEQCVAVVDELLSGPARSAGSPVILTRAGAEQVTAVCDRFPGAVVTPTRIGGKDLSLVAWVAHAIAASPGTPAPVVVVTAGTADLDVAGECVATLAAYGVKTDLLADCGVAGVHRLLGSLDRLGSAGLAVVVAGMEGALASVVGGLFHGPIVAVPVSSGYGAALDGITALLAMMSSCAPGVTVVGIDNGFGAACAALRMIGLMGLGGPARGPGG